MKKLLTVLFLLGFLSSTPTYADVTYPRWDGMFDGAGWPAVGDDGYNLYYASSSSGGYNDELWRYNSLNGGSLAFIGYVDGTIWSLTYRSGKIYVGGYFEETYNPSATLVNATNIAVVNESTKNWSAIGVLPDVPHVILTINSTNIYVGTQNYESTSLHLDRSVLKHWDGTAWTAVGGGLILNGNDTPGVYALEWDNTNLFVGGAFLGASNAASGCDISGTNCVLSTNIIRWTPGTATWSSMFNGGLVPHGDTWVWSLARIGNEIYAAGNFLWSNGIARCYTTGTPIGWGNLTSGGGPSGGTRGISVLANGNDIYVTGIFTNTGSIAANAIAKWNKTSNSWSALETGLRYFTPPSTYSFGEGTRLTKDANSIFVWGGYNRAGSVSAMPARWQLSEDVK